MDSLKTPGAHYFGNRFGAICGACQCNWSGFCKKLRRYKNADKAGFAAAFAGMMFDCMAAAGGYLVVPLTVPTATG